MVIEKGTKKKESNNVLDGLIDIYIQNPNNSAEDSVYIQLVYEVTVHIDIREDYRLTGEVKKLRTGIKDYKAYFQTNTVSKELSQRLNLLDPILISYMNKKLEEGLELPLPSWLTTLTTKPRFKQYEGYYLFDAEPIEDPANETSD